MKLLAELLLATIAISIVVCDVACAHNVQNRSANAGHVRKALKNSQNPEFQSEILTKIIDLPAVQPYPGHAEFVSGRAFPHVKGGPSVTMRVSIKDEPQAALKWYENMLSQNQWQKLNNMTGSTGLAFGNSSHNICQIMPLEHTKPGSKCDLLIRYKFYRPTDFSSQI